MLKKCAQMTSALSPCSERAPRERALRVANKILPFFLILATGRFHSMISCGSHGVPGRALPREGQPREVNLGVEGQLVLRTQERERESSFVCVSERARVQGPG